MGEHLCKALDGITRMCDMFLRSECTFRINLVKQGCPVLSGRGEGLRPLWVKVFNVNQAEVTSESFKRQAQLIKRVQSGVAPAAME